MVLVRRLVVRKTRRYVLRMVEDGRCLSVVFAVLPWLLVVAGTTLFFLGLYYADYTEADTANGVMLIVGVVLLLVAFAISCIRNQTPRNEPKQAEPTPERDDQLLPRVNIKL